MPELPDVEVYVERVAAKAGGAVLRELTLHSAFVLRTAVPPVSALFGRTLAGVRRLGKRVVLQFEAPEAPEAASDPLFLVIHLMIAGRLQWLKPEAKPPRHALATLAFDTGRLVLTEAGKRHRASLHVVAGEAALAAMDPGGLEPLRIDAAAFAERLKRENRTVKRALTDPRLFAGIGNAYADEILHRAKLSPLALTGPMKPPEAQRLFDAVRTVLAEWIDRLRAEAGDFPTKVTAFHPAMAVHGRYGQACPVCDAPVQRIVHAENETNYCARCQTGGRLLADRALSRLLKDDRPKHLDDLA